MHAASSRRVLALAVVGLSQGGVIVRAYAQQYAGTGPFYPPVINLVSVCGVLNGVWDCPLEIKLIPGLCELYSANPYRESLAAAQGGGMHANGTRGARRALSSSSVQTFLTATFRCPSLAGL